jgi:uncharacterized phage protein (TIGR02218 family)
MKTIPPLLLADLQQSTTYIAFLWTITQADGVVIRGTEHDQDITLPASDPNAGTYYAIANVTASDIAGNSDLSVDNLEVTGAMATAPYTTIPDISVQAIEAGLLDMAPVHVIVCNWMAPSHGSFIIKSGFLGAITRTSDGKYTTEVRGMTQLLAQKIMDTYAPTCTVVAFGDARCKKNVAAITVTGTVSSGASPQVFGVALTQPNPPNPYALGTITFISGANTGFSREVKTDPNTNGGVLSLYEPLPSPVAPGDAFKLIPGCARTIAACKHYGNLPNYRGYGVFVPGIDAILAGPAAVAEL